MVVERLNGQSREPKNVAGAEAAANPAKAFELDRAVLDDDQGILPLERVVSVPVSRSEREPAQFKAGVRPALEKRKHFPFKPPGRRKLIVPQASGRSLPRRLRNIPRHAHRRDPFRP